MKNLRSCRWPLRPALMIDRNLYAVVETIGYNSFVVFALIKWILFTGGCEQW